MTEENKHEAQEQELPETNDEQQVDETEEAIAEEVDPILSEVEDLKKQVDQMEDKFLRASAEIANITSRNRNERELLQKYRSQDLAKKVLPALDNLERAMAIEAKDEHSQNLKKGVEMVLESLRHALKEEGIEEIPAKGETFDPTLHQAVQTMPAQEGQEADTIIEELQKGYKLYDRVLRPSMVIVAQNKEIKE
ncbi:nucleotide exchange factor GrpE [Enterococcus italicus]|uniref:nucleotide exchange factor GrpE n=1 Tax=Enterococcus italicus TaxID=246144 RepID=UPI003F45758E